MREWIPVPGSTKERLVRGALGLFAAHGHDAVSVHAIADAAGVTTGSLYHHFGGKPRLYCLVRTDVERRARDRIEGALAVSDSSAGLGGALVVGFDWLVKNGYARLVGEPNPYPEIAESVLDDVGVVRPAPGLPEHPDAARRLLAFAVWRAALVHAVDAPQSVTQTRVALAEILRRA